MENYYNVILILLKTKQLPHLLVAPLYMVKGHYVCE
jgi:hypothetical protein